ncbi:MAG: glycosyltransferase 87 family protein [Candidatus Kariarchaeaceae archaeon]
MKRQVLANNWITKIRSYDFWEKNLSKIWFIGILARTIATLFNISYIDYQHFRLPIAKRIASGEPPYVPITSESLSVNNHMPIYPYIAALMYLLSFPLDSATFTAFMIKLPLAIADGLIPIVLFQIAKQLDRERVGVFCSVLYALNPMTMQEVSYSHWDGFANLFILLALLFLLKNQPYLVGLAISIGFFMKQFPLFFLGVVFVYWIKDIRKLFKVALSFSAFGTILLIFILAPYGTPLMVMFDSITYHPIYQGETQVDAGEEKTPSGFAQVAIKGLRFLFGGDYDTWKIIWIILLGLMLLFPLYLYLVNPSEEAIIQVTIVQILLLSIFFVSIHDQFFIWIIPLLGYWVFHETGKIKTRLIIYVSFTFVYFIRKLDIFFITDPLSAIIATIIIYDCFNNISKKNSFEEKRE